MAFTYNESGGTSQSGTLPWYNDYVKNLLSQGQNLAAPGVYTGQRVAGFTPAQQQAFNLAQQQVGSWAPQVGQAGNVLGQAAQQFQELQTSPYTQGALSAYGAATQQAQFDPTKQQQFMNPYISNVTNEIARLGNQNFQQNILSGLNTNFTEAGQFGSARQMAAAADAAAKAQREISGAQGNALFQAQQAAGQQYGDWANRGINAQQAQAQGLMGVNQFLQGLGTSQGQLAGYYGQLGQLGQQLGQQDVNALLATGNQQQALQQQQLGAQQQQFQEQQAQPWARLGQWSNLFKVPTPQQSTSQNTSWSTNFKKGGLVRLAEGGLYDDSEGADYPPELGVAQSPMDLARQAAQMRSGFMEYAKNSPELRALPERGLLDQGGEAMLRAAAQGPANWGQLIGRAGTAYYDLGAAREQENRAREIARLGLMEKALPRGTGLGLGGGMGGTEKLSQARGKDGSLWQLSSTDRGYMKLLQPGNYATDIAREATTAADKDMEGATGLTTAEKKTERQRLISEYTKMLSAQYAGLGATPVGGAVEPPEAPAAAPVVAPPTGRPAAPKTGGGVGVPTGAFDLSKGEASVRAEIARVADPAERKAAGEALDRQIAEGRGGLKPSGLLVPTPEEKEEQQKVGGEYGKRFADIQKAGSDSENRMNMLTSMADLLTGVQTGKLTPVGTDIAAWAQSANKAFGSLTGFQPVDIDKNLGNKEAFRALANQFALQLRSPAGGAGMPGALSEGDRKFLESMSPSLALSPGGVQKMLETYTALERRNKDVARLARQYRASNPRGTFDAGFDDYLREWSEQHPLFTENKLEQTTPAAGKKPKRGDVVNGYQYIGPADGDRRNPNNWRRVE